MNSLLQDLRFGLRMLVKSPVFTAVAIVTLALAIGANTAIFSVVDAVLLRPLPYPEADRLVFLWETMHSQGVPMSGSALPNYHAWRDQNQVFEGLSGYYYGDFNLASGGAPPEIIQGAYTTANLFEVLRVAPTHGRHFTKEEEQFGNHRVAMLSHGLWQRHFSGDASVVGRSISLAGERYTVVGVMPKDMPFFDNVPAVELWTPMAFEAEDSRGTRNNHFINLVGRLRPGVSPQQAQADVSAIAQRMEHDAGNSGIGALIVPMQDQLTGDSRKALLILLGAVGFVLLVACVNVANLLLARASARAKEFAIRASLGAGRARIVRQVLAECLPLGIVGGTIGVLLAIWGIELLSTFLPTTLPRGNQIEVNARVLMFTSGLALLAILIFGLLPAFHAGKSDLRESLNEGGRDGTGGHKQGRLRRMLVVAEVALALILLVGSGLMVRSFMKLRQVDLGYTATNVLTMRVPLPAAKYPSPLTATDPSEPAGLRFYEQLLGRLKTVPGVESATVASVLPLGTGDGWGKFLSIQGREATSMDQVPIVQFALVSPNYFDTFGINLRKGRAFVDQDTGASQQVAIINETIARRYFPNEDPIGKTIWMGPPEHLFPPSQQTAGNFPRRTIVGVVSDVKGSNVNQPSAQQVYAPVTQYRREGWINGMMLAVRTTAAPQTVAASVREQVRAIDRDQAVTNVRTMEEVLGRRLSESKFALLLFSLFAGLALLLAAIGIYGVTATSVTQRTHEIGLRMALGAQKGDVLRLVISQAMTMVAIGIVAGLAAAIALTRLMASLLFDVSATDPLTFIAIGLILSVTALLASYLPAWRATKVDPLVALRYE